MAKTAEELNNELAIHLQYSIEHGGFCIGEHAQGGCSCSICTYLRGHLVVKYYIENGHYPEKYKGE